jgi:hypothetical protein
VHRITLDRTLRRARRAVGCDPVGGVQQRAGGGAEVTVGGAGDRRREVGGVMADGDGGDRLGGYDPGPDDRHRNAVPTNLRIVLASLTS